MTYRKVNPIKWDDEFIIDADDFTRTVWDALLTGPQVVNLPGLMLTTANALADVLRRDPAKVREVLKKMEELGRIEVDERHRLIRLPNAPKYNEPENQKVLKGWWYRWIDLPDSPLKYKHIASLRVGFEISKSKCLSEKDKPKLANWEEAWASTFGTVESKTENGSESEQSGYGIANSSDTDIDTVSIHGQETNRTPEPLPLPEPEEDAPAHTKKDEDVFDPTKFATPDALSSQSQANLVALEETWQVVTDPIYRRELAVGIAHDHKGKDTASEIRRIGEKNNRKPQSARVVMKNVGGYLDTCLRGVFSPQAEKPQERQRPKEWVPPEPRSLMNMGAEIEAEQAALNEKYRKLAEEAKAKEDAK